MNNWKTYVIIILFLVLIFSVYIMNMRYSKLEKENIELKSVHSIVDSVKMENESLYNKVIVLNEQIDIYSHQIDSLKKVKQAVIIKTEYIVSDNITESVKILKENLKWERL